MSVFQIMVRRKPTGGLFFVGIPVVAVWIVLLPLGILLSPFLLVGCLIADVNPFRLVAALCRTLNSLKGTQVEFEDRRRAYVLRIA